MDLKGKRVYLAGPMRGIPEFNFPTFNAAAADLRSLGAIVFNPAETPHDDQELLKQGQTLPLKQYMAVDLREVCEADAVVVLPGWKASQGASLEVHVAKTCGIPVLSLDLQPIADDSGEVRVTDPTTGGEKGSKLARYDLIPAGPLEALARHYGIGCRKYADRNWERGYKWSLSFAAMMRHAWAFWRGEEIDAETQSPHLAAVAWHALALLEFCRTKRDHDDRPKS